jgi:hypothetical protein
VDQTGVTGQIRADLACPAEVRVTVGTMIRARLIRAATCPWWQQYQARDRHGPHPLRHRRDAPRAVQARPGGNPLTVQKLPRHVGRLGSSSGKTTFSITAR